MGTGGVQFLTQPAIEIARNATVFPVQAAFSAQVVLESPAGLDDKALDPSVPLRDDQGKCAASVIPEEQGCQNAIAYRTQRYAAWP